MPAWTTERPSVLGWYWAKHRILGPVIVHVLSNRNGCVVIEHDSGWLGEATEWCEAWYGPLQPPPDSPSAPSTAEAMAMAVLAGDMVAARGLADWLVEHDAGRTPAMLPDEFAQAMQNIVDAHNATDGGDASFRIAAEHLMADALGRLGYAEGIDAYNKTPKWYA